MPATPRIIAVIPARGNSRGLPGKNLRVFAGLPLIAHSIRYAQRSPAIERVVVSTDSTEIAEVARTFGAEVPFMRPAELSTDTAPTWPVLQHAVDAVEGGVGKYDWLVLLEPTSPARRLHYVPDAIKLLEQNPAADGLVAVSQPDFNPLWRGVVKRDGWMEDLSDLASRFERRQDVPTVYKINGALYIWRREFLAREDSNWRKGKHLAYETPELLSMSIDTLEDFQKAELLVNSGMINLEWLDRSRGS
jgi:CMP-N,N'-diacetyllegionaminic acid synthase